MWHAIRIIGIPCEAGKKWKTGIDPQPVRAYNGGYKGDRHVQIPQSS